jgi:hypothetical protein
MAVVPNESELAADKMLGPATQRMAALGAALTGSGPAAAFKAMSDFASGMPSLAAQAADSVLKLRSDETLPSGHRLIEGNAQLAAAKTMLTKLNDGAHAEHGKLEQALTTALLPAPHRDPAQRSLNIQRAQLRFGHLSGERLVAAITRRLGQDATVDSELLSETGADFFAGRDVDEDSVHAMRIQATEAYLKKPPTEGSHQQLAARKAFTTLRELNIKGHIAAYQQAARLHLSKAD